MHANGVGREDSDSAEFGTKMILKNRRIAIREVADNIDISFDSCQANFSNVLGMLAANFVPKLSNFGRRFVYIAQVLLNGVQGSRTYPVYGLKQSC